MIYDEIEASIAKYLIEDYNIYPDAILTENEVPNEDLDFFVRSVWTYGTCEEMSIADLRELAILNLEVYERKNIQETKIIDLIHNFRYTLSKEISMFYGTDAYAKLNGIYILKNMNEENWTSYTLGIRFYIYKEK